MVRRSNEPGDFYFTWRIRVLKCTSQTIPDIQITPTKKKEYDSAAFALRAGERYAELFNLNVVKRDRVIENDSTLEEVV